MKKARIYKGSDCLDDDVVRFEDYGALWAIHQGLVRRIAVEAMSARRAELLEEAADLREQASKLEAEARAAGLEIDGDDE